MIAVFAITDGTDRQHHLYVWTTLPQDVNGFPQIVGTLIYGQLLFLEETLRSFLTVVHNLSCLFQTVDMISS